MALTPRDTPRAPGRGLREPRKGKENHQRGRRSILMVLALLILGCVACANRGDPFDPNAEVSIPVSASNPVNGATGVDPAAVLTVNFPVEVQVSTLLPANVILQKTARLESVQALVPVTFSYDNSRREITITPMERLDDSQAYQVVLQGLVATNGVPIETSIISFTTGQGPTAPAVTSVSPRDGAAGVNVNSPITLTFSRSMDLTSVTSSFTLFPRVLGTFTLEQNGTRLQFEHPGQPFPIGQTFTISLREDARDAQGVPLGRTFTSQFSTPRAGAFRIVSTIPSEGNRAQADTDIQLTFGEPVDITSARANILLEPAGLSPSIAFSSRDQVAEIQHANIPGGTAVRVTARAGLLSAAGVTLGQSTGGRDFVLQYTVENDPPELSATNPTVPANGATQVAPGTSITFNFNEALDASTVNASTFAVTRNNTAVAGTLTLESGGRSIVFRPAAPFQAGSSPVVATARAGIQDLGGTATTGDISISFTIDDQAPSLALTDPANGAIEIPVNRSNPTLIIEFSEAVNQTDTTLSLTPSRSTTRTGNGGTNTFVSATRLHYVLRDLLLGNTQYTVSVQTSDLAGNRTPTPLTFSFTTDSQPPLVDQNLVTPQCNSPVRIPANSTFSITFSELMDEGSVEQAFSLSPVLPSVGPTFSRTNGVFTFVEVGMPPRTSATFTFVGTQLPESASYQVNIDTRAADLGLNRLPSTFFCRFLTLP